MSATEEVLEEALELTEQTLDALEASCTLTPRQHLIQSVALGALGGIVGGVATYYYLKNKMETRYEQLMEEELAEAKAFYSKLHKTGDMSTPEKAVVALRESNPGTLTIENDVDDAADALRTYQGDHDDGTDDARHTFDDESDDEPVDWSKTPPNNPEDIEVVAYMRPIEDDGGFDWEKELSSRSDDHPYIIHEEEFMGNELDYTQTAINYYAGDNTLADERDQEIPFIEPILGEDNLKFGYGSEDPRIVFIRNDRLSTEFEVALHDTKYAHEVLGMEHSDGGARAQRRRNEPRKHRGEYE